MTRARAARRCLFGVIAAASAAQAAPPEVFSEIALHPTDRTRIVLSYVQGGQGLLFSNDGGLTFSLRCGAAVSSSFTKSRAPLWQTSDGEALLGTFEGLVHGRSDGCGFGMDEALTGLQVADFARDPRDASVTYLATANATDGQVTGLVRLGADGMLTPLGSNDTASATSGNDGAGLGASMNRLAVAVRPDGGLRFYASALRADAEGNYYPIIRHSDDDGASWTSFDVAGADGARVVLVGVDPTNADRVAIALSRDSANDSVLVSADAGQSFEPQLDIFELGASSVSPDGRLWVGDAGGESEYSQPGGLYRFDDFGAAPQKLATMPVRCLAYRADPEEMFACQRNAFGRVDPTTGAFTRLSSLTDVKGFVACEGEALAPVCKPQLCDNWCGVLHYASAPLCDAYSEVNPLCGPAARGYGQAAPPAMGDGLVLPGDEPAATSSDAGANASGDPSGNAGDAPNAATAGNPPRSADGGCQIETARRPTSRLVSSAGVCGLLALALRRRIRRQTQRVVRE
ncbi:MAG TPA: hypothetical protein VMG12_14105 [Polyangiaceae bacterium]|nr:hypothetical protein [Polyangiaceae bacterium]